MSVDAIYQRPYRPTIFRDVLADCGIAQYEIEKVAGISAHLIRLMANRGYIPVYKKSCLPAIESFISRNQKTQSWLREKRLTVKQIWEPSGRRVFHLNPADHGERVYHSRTHHTAPACRQAGPRCRRSRSQKNILIQKRRKKQIMENGLATLAAYGYRTNPFEDVRIRTGDGDILKRLFHMAVESTAMVSVIAPWGAGKTTAIDAALEGMDCHPLRIITADKERLGIHDIERSMIRILAPSEKISRDRDMRARQVSRIVGEAARTKPVILILEESHCMHHSTLRALKRVREYSWMGKRPLMSIILIGQYDRLKSGNLEEVRQGTRSDTFKLKGLAPSEAARYIAETVGDHIEPEAVKALSELPSARNFLDLQETLIIVMEATLKGGSKIVTVLDVFSTFGGGLKQLIDRYDIKQSQIAEMIGEDKSTVSLIINNRPHTLSGEREGKVKSAIAEALKTLIPQGKHHKPDLKAVQ